MIGLSHWISMRQPDFQYSVSHARCLVYTARNFHVARTTVACRSKRVLRAYNRCYERTKTPAWRTKTQLNMAFTTTSTDLTLTAHAKNNDFGCCVQKSSKPYWNKKNLGQYFNNVFLGHQMKCYNIMTRTRIYIYWKN